jgi:hypothetical protein
MKPMDDPNTTTGTLEEADEDITHLHGFRRGDRG